MGVSAACHLTLCPLLRNGNPITFVLGSGLLLILLDNLRRANVRFVRISPDVAAAHGAAAKDPNTDPA